MADIAIYATAIAERGWAFLATTATLMSMVHFRNSHLSEKARSNVSEQLYNLQASTLDPSIKQEHRESLLWQAEFFLSRYRSMSNAFALFAFALVFQAIAIILCGATVESLQISGLTLGFLSVALWIWAITIAAGEFLTGYKTLERHVAILRRKF